MKASNRKDTDIYEIELNVSVAGIRGDEKIYVVELKYVGLFEITNLTEDIREAYFLVECPRQLFSFRTSYNL